MKFKQWMFACSMGLVSFGSFAAQPTDQQVQKLMKIMNIDQLLQQTILQIRPQLDQQAYAIADTSPTAEDKLITEQNLSRLLRYIKELKPHYQEVIQLRYFQEMSYQEIAEQLNEPLTNVKIKLLRAKKLLAEIIQGK